MSSLRESFGQATMSDRTLRCIVWGALLLAIGAAAGCNIHRTVEPPPQSDASMSDASDVGDCVEPDSDGEADIICSHAKSTCGEIIYEDSCGVEHQVDCGGCEVDETCSGSPTDLPRRCDCECFIEESCHRPGDQNPENECEICTPETSRVTWTVDEGASCGSGGGPPCSCQADGRCERANGSACE